MLEDSSGAMRRLALFLTLSCLAIGSWAFGETRSADPVDEAQTLEIERSKQGWVVVNLRGGPTGYEEPSDAPALAPATTLARGRVADANGNPVEGVVVVGGDRLAVLTDGLTGRDAARTDENGRFELSLDQDALLVAVHLEHGMSRVTRASEGQDVELTLEPFTWVEGFVREHDSPSEAMVILHSPDHAFTFVSRTDASGHYTLGPLPPGAYRVEAYDQGSTNGIVAFPSPRVEAVPGRTTTQDILENDPGTVRVDYRRTDSMRIATVSVALFEGERTVDTDARYVELFQRREGVYGASTIGQHDEYTVFRGVPEGTYTACARSNLGEQGMHVSCEPVTVHRDRVNDVDLKLYAG